MHRGQRGLARQHQHALVQMSTLPQQTSMATPCKCPRSLILGCGSWGLCSNSTFLVRKTRGKKMDFVFLEKVSSFVPKYQLGPDSWVGHLVIQGYGVKTSPPEEYHQYSPNTVRKIFCPSFSVENDFFENDGALQCGGIQPQFSAPLFQTYRRVINCEPQLLICFCSG